MTTTARETVMPLRLLAAGALASLLAAPHALRAADRPGAQQSARLETRVTVQMDYLLYLPKDYAQRERWPLLLFLHGAGERGSDLERVKTHGPPKLIAEGKEFPMIVVSPQCPQDRWWEPLELLALLDNLGGRYKVDPDRVYVTGISMGGFGTWRLAAYAPQRLAAIAPICGGGEPLTAKMFANLPAWAFHGAKDPIVPLERSQAMVDAIERFGGERKLTIYPEADHDSWTATYNNPEFYEWLLAQKRQPQK